ncbi:hypothetical protein D3C84_680750 [compost metagenome]
MGRVVTAAVTTNATAACLAAQRAGARPGRTAVPATLAAQTTTAATATTVKRPCDTAAATAARCGV